MGWTCYHADYYKANGEIDRKSECDSMFENVLKSAMYGSTYYAAVEENGKIVGEVMLTAVDKTDHLNFYYKPISEDMGPYQSDCPRSILDLLDPTDNEYAKAWRERCRENVKKRTKHAKLSALPIGTKILCTIEGHDGEYELVKHYPNHQFKKPFWVCEKEMKYVSKSYISDYKII